MKYFIQIAYKGTAYHGWQIQQNARSVQQEISEGISKILRQEILVQGSGRTDTGVHCLQQFAHFEHEVKLDKHLFLRRINSLLPADISIDDLLLVQPEAHARFSALSRKYLYKITQKKDPFLTDYAFFHYRSLDLKNMQKAADLLLTWEDYTAFSKTNSNNEHNLCKVTHAYFEQQKHMLLFHIEANRFLRGMVRLITGALLQVGQQNIAVKDLENLLKSKKITGKRYAVPAHGLYLESVQYPEEIFIKD